MLCQYTAELLCLNLCRSPVLTPCPQLNRIQTPLNHSAWAGEPPGQGICPLHYQGHRGGFQDWVPPHCPPAISAPQYAFRPGTPGCRAGLYKERSMGHMLGPFSVHSLTDLSPLHINRFGVIPKGHNTGKWLLITDLSYPPGLSVNDGIRLRSLLPQVYFGRPNGRGDRQLPTRTSSREDRYRVGIPPCPGAPA